MLFRAALPSDRQAVIDIVHGIYNGMDYLAVGYNNYLHDRQSVCALVENDDGRPIAFGIYRVDANNQLVYREAMRIHPSYRNRRILPRLEQFLTVSTHARFPSVTTRVSLTPLVPHYKRISKLGTASIELEMYNAVFYTTKNRMLSILDEQFNKRASSVRKCLNLEELTPYTSTIYQLLKGKYIPSFYNWQLMPNNAANIDTILKSSDVFYTIDEEGNMTSVSRCNVNANQNGHVLRSFLHCVSEEEHVSHMVAHLRHTLGVVSAGEVLHIRVLADSPEGVHAIRQKITPTLATWGPSASPTESFIVVEEQLKQNQAKL